jgi:hypothetical protein
MLRYVPERARIAVDVQRADSVAVDAGAIGTATVTIRALGRGSGGFIKLAAKEGGEVGGCSGILSLGLVA